MDVGNLFGASVADIGDLNGDGVPVMLVGVSGNGDSGDLRGAVYIRFMDAVGAVQAYALKA